MCRISTMRVLGRPSGVEVAIEMASRSSISPFASSNHRWNCTKGFGSQSDNSKRDPHLTHDTSANCQFGLAERSHALAPS